MTWDGVHRIIERAKGGDEDAWRSLHELTRPYMVSQAQRLLGPGWPHRSVSDLTQDTWRHVVASLSSFRGGDDDPRTAAMFRAWIRQMMRNIHANVVRHDQAEGRRAPSGRVSLGGPGPVDSATLLWRREPATGEPTPSACAWHDERQSRIATAIAGLEDPEDRELLLLHFFEGLSLRAIATARGINPDRLRYRFHDVLRRLGRELKDLV